MSLITNLQAIQNRIQAACDRSMRPIESVTLVHVSKTQPIEVLEAGYQLGMRVFGENKVQEIREKVVALPMEDIRWHMIGHLQRNKVKYIVDSVSLIHSVDSIRLAKTISDEAAKKNRIIDILIQVNMADETTKFGFRDQDQLMHLIKEIAVMKNIRIKGLMTIAPYVENPEDNRMIFRQMRQLSVDIKDQNIDNVYMDELSMGMTGDFEVAIEEGATMVRIGTAIFGERQYIN